MTTGEGTVANHLRLEYLAEDQPNGFLPPGLHVDVGTPVTSLGSKQTVALPISLWGDNAVAGTERISGKGDRFIIMEEKMGTLLRNSIRTRD